MLTICTKPHPAQVYDFRPLFVSHDLASTVFPALGRRISVSISPAALGLVQGRALLAEGGLRGQLRDEADDRIDGGGTERESQHDDNFRPQPPAARGIGVAEFYGPGSRWREIVAGWVCGG